MIEGSADSYLLWSGTHGAWWLPNEKGFTKDLRDAGAYTLDAAMDIAIREAKSRPMHPALLDALPVRLGDVQAIQAAVRGRPLPPVRRIYPKD